MHSSLSVSAAAVTGLFRTAFAWCGCATIGLTLCFAEASTAYATPKAASTPPVATASVVPAKKAPATAVGKAKPKKQRKRRLSVQSLLPQDTRAALRSRGIYSGYGMRVVSGTARLHKGIDISAPKGAKIIAFNDGEVVFAGTRNGFGNTVVVRQIDGRLALYAHMDRFVVQKGDQVRRGTHIGHVGRTGRATGFHLHFELEDNGEVLDPSLHVWHGSELVINPHDLDFSTPAPKTQLASPKTKRDIY